MRKLVPCGQKEGLFFSPRSITGQLATFNPRHQLDGHDDLGSSKAAKAWFLCIPASFFNR